MNDLIDIMKEDLDTYIAEISSVCVLQSIKKMELIDTYRRICKMKHEMEGMFKGLNEFNPYE